MTEIGVQSLTIIIYRCNHIFSNCRSLLDLFTGQIVATVISTALSQVVFPNQKTFWWKKNGKFSYFHIGFVLKNVCYPYLMTQSKAVKCKPYYLRNICK